MKIKLSLLILTAGIFWFLYSQYQTYFVIPVPPAPRVGDLIVSNAYVESVDLIQFTDPPSVTLFVTGSLPDPCLMVDEVKFFQQDTTLNYIITAVKPHDASCSLDQKSFEHVIEVDLSTLQPGTYQVNVNGTTQSFKLN